MEDTALEMICLTKVERGRKLKPAAIPAKIIR